MWCPPNFGVSSKIRIVVSRDYGYADVSAVSNLDNQLESELVEPLNLSRVYVANHQDRFPPSDLQMQAIASLARQSRLCIL